MFAIRTLSPSIIVVATIGLSCTRNFQARCDQQTTAVQTKTTSAAVKQQWDMNWDGFEKDSTGKETKAVHHIVLIRHGQYEQGKDDDVDRVLTTTGKKQAVATGKRLRELLDGEYLSPIDRLYVSTMIRASQTADLILPFLPLLDKPGQVQKCSMIREGACYKPEPPISRDNWDVGEADFFRDGMRIEAGFRAHIKRAPVERQDSYTTVLVCHGNVIRYMVCRALQQDPAGWLRMSVANSSITVLSIYPSGKVSLKTLGDVGFLTTDLITYN